MSPCERLELPGGDVAFVRFSWRRHPRCGQRGCANRADLLCDFPTPGGKTCDAKICSAHAKEVGPDKHVCPAHAAAAVQEELL